MKLFAVKNMTNEKYLNYAKKKKKLIGKCITYKVVESSFPTLRPEEHIKKCFNVWIINTPYPSRYKVVEFEELK